MTQILPSGDTFDLGGAALPDYYSSWISCDGFPTAVAFGSGGAVPTATIQTREPKSLTDAYSPSASSRLASFPVGDFSANGGDLGMVLRRDVVTNNDSAAVEAAFQVLHFGGALGNNVPAFLFVCARVSGMGAGGPAAKSWGDEYFLSAGGAALSGYFFGQASSVGGGSRFYLVKVTAGTVSTLTQAMFNPSGGTHLYTDVFPDKTAPHFYRMTFAAGAGGSLDITCTVGTGASSQVVLTANDASPLATAGRSGFLAPSEVELGTLKYVVALPYCQITVGGTVQVRDEWVRRQPEDAQLAQDAIHTTAIGRDLRSGWTGDALGVQDFGAGALDPWLRDGTAFSQAGRTVQKANVFPIGSSADTWKQGYCLSQRTTTQANTHHRSIRARFGLTGLAPTGTERRWAGVVLRAGTGISEGNVPRGGYLFQVSTDDGGTFATGRYELWRIASSGTSALLIAEGTPTILVDTDYTVALQAFNAADASGNPDGVVVLRAFLDGVQLGITLTADAIAAGLADGGGGVLLDNTSGAIRTSTGEGFRVAGYTGERGTFVDDWTELALENEVGTGEEDQATISVLSETWDHTAETLTLPPYWLVEETATTEVDAFEFELGHVRRSPRYSDDRRTWAVRVSACADAERGALLDFWDEHEGMEKAFDWTPPLESDPVVVHFATDELGLILRNPGVTSFEFDLEQLLES